MSNLDAIGNFSSRIYPSSVRPIIPTHNKVHEAIANDQIVFAAFLSNADLRIVEAVISPAEFDDRERENVLIGPTAVFIDYEHAPFTTREVETLVIYLNAAGVVPLVRVRENTPATFKPFLDMGAQGIVIPQIGSKEDAVRAWEACFYSKARPAGVGRASEFFGRFSEYQERADDLMSVILMVERRDAVDNIRDICQVLRPEKDLLHIGPFDLGLDLERTQGVSITRQEAIDRIEEAAAQHHIKLAGHTSTLSQARDMFDRGYRLLTYGEPFEAGLTRISEQFFGSPDNR